jgi:hypothetical protein
MFATTCFYHCIYILSILQLFFCIFANNLNKTIVQSLKGADVLGRRCMLHLMGTAGAASSNGTGRDGEEADKALQLPAAPPPLTAQPRRIHFIHSHLVFPILSLVSPCLQLQQQQPACGCGCGCEPAREEGGEDCN